MSNLTPIVDKPRRGRPRIVGCWLPKVPKVKVTKKESNKRYYESKKQELTLLRELVRVNNISTSIPQIDEHCNSSLDST
jgi:hypothetical protein